MHEKYVCMCIEHFGQALSHACFMSWVGTKPRIWTTDWIIYSVLDWVTEPTNTKTMCWEKSNWLEAEYSLASHTLCEGLIV